MTTAYGGIEAGGTKFVCAAGSGPNDLWALETIPTTTPDETLARVVEFLRRACRKRPLDAIGIGSFGPVDLDPGSSTYGRVTGTPKPNWVGANVAVTIRDALGLPVALDTDVNAAVLGERLWGAAVDVDDAVYMTIGTGIGGGAIVNGELLHGALHPEMGHVRVPHDRASDPFEGSCPYHGNCLEGLASGPALEERWGVPPETLPDDHPAWEIEARYLAYGAAAIAYILSPRRIIMCGGVMKRAALLPMVRRNVRSILSGYFKWPASPQEFEEFIVRPGLGGRAGVLGAIALAMRQQRSR